MNDSIRKWVGILMILFVCGLSAMAIMVNQESGPPEDMTIREAPQGGGCIPVCGSVIVLFAMLIVRVGVLL